MPVNQNAERIKQNVFDRVVRKYDTKFREVIEKPRIWDAGFKTTKQKSRGEVIGSFRNIVDLGELKRSQKLDFNFGINEAVISWDVPHAGLVYFGFIHTSGETIPARPWAKVGIFELGDAELAVL